MESSAGHKYNEDNAGRQEEGFAAVPTDSEIAAAVPKSMRGLVPGGSLPGAFDIRVRARGEVPVWHPQQQLHDEEEEDNNNSSSPLDVELTTLPIPPTEELAFDAELVTHPQDDVLVIDGVKTSKYWIGKRGIAVLIVFVGLACGAGYKAWKETTRLVNRQAGNNQQQGASPSNISTTAVGTTVAESGAGSLNWTIAAAWNSYHDGDTLSTFIREETRDLFLQVVNDTDKNFTLFDIWKKASFPKDPDMSLVSKIMQVSWAGHMVSSSCTVIQLTSCDIQCLPTM